MIWIGIGCISFLLFILYDFNQIRSNHAFLKPLFLTGSFVLVFVTIKLSVTAYEGDFPVAFPAVAVFYFLAAVNLGMLVYTLFFAVPFQEAYVEGSKQTICKEGVYALCRHPGVLFLAGAYLFLGLALGRPMMILAGFIFTVLNLIYIWIQDTYIFPVLFDGYEEYKTETPYLLPTLTSIQHSAGDLGRRYGRNRRGR